MVLLRPGSVSGAPMARHGQAWPQGYQDNVAHGEGLSGQVLCLPSWPGVPQLSTPTVEGQMAMTEDQRSRAAVVNDSDVSTIPSFATSSEQFSFCPFSSQSR